VIEHRVHNDEKMTNQREANVDNSSEEFDCPDGKLIDDLYPDDPYRRTTYLVYHVIYDNLRVLTRENMNFCYLS